MITVYIRSILGEVPSAGTNQSYAVLEYVVSAVVLLFCLSLGYRMLIKLFGLNK